MRGRHPFSVRRTSRRSNEHASLGRRGERYASRHLRKSGYRILARNAFAGNGEADIVALDADERTIVIVEVKTRRIDADRPDRRVPPERAVGQRKQRALRSAANALIRANGWEQRPRRIDVVTVEIPRRGKPILRHLPGAVGA